MEERFKRFRFQVLSSLFDGLNRSLREKLQTTRRSVEVEQGSALDQELNLIDSIRVEAASRYEKALELHAQNDIDDALEIAVTAWRAPEPADDRFENKVNALAGAPRRLYTRLTEIHEGLHEVGDRVEKADRNRSNLAWIWILIGIVCTLIGLFIGRL